MLFVSQINPNLALLLSEKSIMPTKHLTPGLCQWEGIFDERKSYMKGDSDEWNREESG